MKRYLIILLLFGASSLVTFAQRHHGKHDFDPAKFKAEMEQFITTEACLTPQEASQFFPLFNEMLRKERALFDQISTLQRVKPATEQGCAEAVRTRDMIEIQIKELQQQYHNRFLKLLPACKVYDAQRAQHRFHRQMFKREVCKNRK